MTSDEPIDPGATTGGPDPQEAGPLPAAGDADAMSDADDDAARSALFTTIATIADLITPAQRDAALSTWAANPARSIGEVLLGQGVLDKTGLEAVETMVEAVLSRHGGDPSQSLLALSTPEDDRRADSSSVVPASAPADPNETTVSGLDARGDDSDARPTGPRFRFLRPHARGGLGEVHVAMDGELDREVALKEIRHRFADDPASRARFLVEAKITGNLEHPGIVPVYGLGRHADGRPYYAMRFVRGESLKDAIERFHRGEARPKSPGDREVRLRKLIVRFLAVCDAVEYAHSRGVIHRDIKPANILLGPYGETLLVDWGLAKPIGAPGREESIPVATGEGPEPGPDLDATVAGTPPPTPVLAVGSNASDHTRPGSAVGTPHYMPPEQARGELDRLGPSSDVYSLGATLYALITGCAPVDGQDLKTVIDRVKAGQLVPARARDRTVDPALEAICSKAMATDPGDRYPSARALADDLECWLADEPVSARREPALARLGRWARRHKPWVAGGAAALLVGLASLGLVAKARLDREAARLDRAKALAEALASNMEAERAQAQAKAAALETRSAQQAERMQRYYALVDRLRRRAADPRPGWTFDALDELRQASSLRADAGDDAGETLRTLAAAALADFDARPSIPLSPGLNPSCVAFSPDGGTIALGEFKAQAYLSCSVALLDPGSGSVSRRLSFPPSIPFQIRSRVQDGSRRLAFGPEGRWLAVGTRSGMVHLWDLSRDAPRPLHSWEAHPEEVEGLAFGAAVADEGQVPALFSCGKDGSLRRWSLAEGSPPPDSPADSFEPGPRVRDVAFHEEAGLACLSDGTLYRLDPETLDPIAEFPGIEGSLLAWSPDGLTLAAGSGRELVLVSAQDGQAFRRLVDPAISAAHRGSPSGLRFHPSGSVLVSSCSSDDDRRIKFWDTSTGRLLGSHHDAEGAGYGPIDVAFDPRGGLLLATSHDRALTFDLREHPAFEAVALSPSPTLALAVSPDGRVLARLSQAGESIRVDVRELPSGTPRWSVDAPADPSGSGGVPSLIFAPGGDRLASCGEGPGAFLWDIGTPEPSRIFEVPSAGSLRFSEDGRRLWALVDGGERLVSWKLDGDGRSLSWSDTAAAILRGLDELTSLEVADPDLLVGGRDGLTRALRREGDSLSLAFQWDHHDGPVNALAVLPGVGLAAAGTLGGSIILFRPSDRRDGSTIADAHPEGVSRLAFAPDGSILASGGVDGRVRLWSLKGETLQPIASLGPASGPIRALGFLPDGSSLAASADGERAIRLWRLDRLRASWEDLGLDFGD
ncbi:WD40 repeat domain-containing serine/threonine protein kinase [Tautonia sociabilis]|uniref:WD40 repeat domain-containing serine/threonine protein kinase n=1 Tax=Tautonia sociabilis TaxID=2080755 RepID=UPI00131551D2|nr:serine/threonine-protein kinase [Tautonia sociabilis]